MKRKRSAEEDGLDWISRLYPLVAEVMLQKARERRDELARLSLVSSSLGDLCHEQDVFSLILLYLLSKALDTESDEESSESEGVIAESNRIMSTWKYNSARGSLSDDAISELSFRK